MQDAKKLSVLVYDDEIGSARATKERLDTIAGLSVDLLPRNHDAIAGLEERRRAARSDKRSVTENLLDTVDILFVDYDLTLDAETPGAAAETGERVAYLTRCYSNCRTIVALNQYHSVSTFDLTLVGHVGSYADINVSADDVDNPGLWGSPHDGFQPWAWPNLSRLPEEHTARVKLVTNAANTPVLQLLGLSSNRISNTLTRKQLAWLSPDEDAQHITVRQSMLRGRLGLRPKDQLSTDESLANLAAARLSKWLERMVLPGQNVLVDAPHLVSRYPSLLAGEREETLARGAGGIAAAPTSAVSPLVTKHRFTASEWVSRRTWLWPMLVEDQDIPEIADPFSPVKESDPFVEDSSRFRPREDVRAFTAEVEPFGRRYATRAPRDDAEASAAPYSGPHGLARVSYQPAVLFALA